MCGNQEASPDTLSHFYQQFSHPLGITAVERRCGFISNQQLGRHGDSSGNGGTLCFALAELEWPRISTVCNCQPVEALIDQIMINPALLKLLCQLQICTQR